MKPPTKYSSLALEFTHKRTALNPNGVLPKTSLGSSAVRIEDHASEVLSCDFNSFGNLFLTTNQGGEIHMCTTKGRRDRMMQLTGHQGPVLDAHFSEDDTVIYSCSADATLGIWDTSLGTRIASLEGHTSSVNTIQRTRYRYTMMCSGSRDKTVRIWDTRTQRSLSTLKCGSEVHAACFTEHTDQVFAAGNNMDIEVWDIRKTSLMTRLRGHTAPVTGLSLSPCGQKLLSHGVDNMLRIWDVQPYTLGNRSIASFPSNDSPAPQGLLRCAWSNNGKMVAAGTAEHGVCIWDANTGEKLHTISGHQACVNDVAFHPRKSIILSTSNDKMAYLNEF